MLQSLPPMILTKNHKGSKSFISFRAEKEDDHLTTPIKMQNSLLIEIFCSINQVENLLDQSII